MWVWGKGGGRGVGFDSYILEMIRVHESACVGESAGLGESERVGVSEAKGEGEDKGAGAIRQKQRRPLRHLQISKEK